MRARQEQIAGECRRPGCSAPSPRGRVEQAGLADGGERAAEDPVGQREHDPDADAVERAALPALTPNGMASSVITTVTNGKASFF